MYKKRKIDFILKERNEYRLIFRFYPRHSHCHGFHENPPTSWDEVYKVYYSYAILEEYDDVHYLTNTKSTDCNWNVRKVFEESCDECSIVAEIGFMCLQIADGKKEYSREIDGETYTWQLLDTEKFPFGMGTCWKIHEYKNSVFNENDEEIFEKEYEFQLFNYDNVGYRFSLKKEQMKDFGQYLLNCCEYMLQHGEPI